MKVLQNRPVADRACCAPIPVDWCARPRVKDVALPPRPFRLQHALHRHQHLVGPAATVARRHLVRGDVAAVGPVLDRLLLYTAGVGLAFVNAIVSLVLYALSAVHYAFPSRA
jgi:hypothetical protein